MSLLSAVLEEVDKVSTEDLKKDRDKLMPKVKDLTERLQHLSSGLLQNFIDNHVNFKVTKSLEQLNYRNRKSNIIADHQKLIEEVTQFQTKFGNEDDEFRIFLGKFEGVYEHFNDLCIVVEGKKILEQAKHEFGRYHYKEAMLLVKDLLKKLKGVKFDGVAAKALENLRDQAETHLALYSAHLSVEWEELFSWEEKKGVNTLTYSLSVQQSDPTHLQKVLKTLHATDRMNAELVLFSHFFVENLLHNVIRYNCDIFTEENIGALIFNIKINLNEKSKPNYQTIFLNLTAIFEFLQSTLGSQFDNGKKFVEVFAESIREKFFSKVIEDCIKTNLPSCDSSYENYKNIVTELDSFNKFLIELKFIEAEKSPLNKYINDTKCVLYNKKCDKLLSDIRQLVNESLSYGMIVVGTETEMEEDDTVDFNSESFWDLNKPIFLPRCVISENVKKILTMIVEHLEESAKLPEQYRRKLVYYIRLIAVLYQCYVPKKFKINLELCPLDIALFFNNCFYLAHGLLGPPWKLTLPSDLADQLTSLLESIQDLRVLGLEKMSLYLQTQKNQILQSVETKASSSSPWTHEAFEDFDSAINKALNLLEDLKMSWYNVLPSRMYEMSMCTLIQALCQGIVDRIFADVRPIEEELIYMIAVRVEDILKDVNALFEEPIKFEAKVKAWTKFTKMPLLLKAQLLEIAEMWNKDKEQLDTFSCEEIRQIIKMRFPDDKYRLEIFKEIQ